MIVAAVFALALSSAVHASFPQAKCASKPVYYEVTFTNFLVGNSGPFLDLIPSNGLAFSPLSAVTHSPRFSFFTVYGFASPQVEQIAETGNNARFLAFAEGQTAVSSVNGSMGPAMPGKSVSVVVKATCAYPYLTALAMIAPSPDWIVQINNMPLLNSNGSFVHTRSGNLFAYDAGTDSSDQFTDPSNAALDMPTEPQQNIILLSQDETDPFGQRPVGLYVVKKVPAPSM